METAKIPCPKCSHGKKGGHTPTLFAENSTYPHEAARRALRPGAAVNRSDLRCDDCGRTFLACVKAKCFGRSYTLVERLRRDEVEKRYPELLKRLEGTA